MNIQRISQPTPRPQRPAIHRNHGPVAMTPRATGQIHHRPRDVFWATQSPVRIHGRQLRHPALLLHKPRRHLRREEPRRDGVAQDMPGPELDGEIPREMDRGRFGGRVPEGRVRAQRARAETGGGGGHDDAAGGLGGRALLEQGGETGFWGKRGAC